MTEPEYDFDDGETSENAAPAEYRSWLLRKSSPGVSAARAFRLECWVRVEQGNRMESREIGSNLDELRKHIPPGCIRLAPFPGDPSDLLELWA